MCGSAARQEARDPFVGDRCRDDVVRAGERDAVLGLEDAVEGLVLEVLLGDP